MEIDLPTPFIIPENRANSIRAKLDCHANAERDNARMLILLLVLLTVVPILELVILLQVHHAVASAWGGGMGLLVTLGTIFVTGVTGAMLARQQGLSVLRELRQQMGGGQFPGRTIVDGALILVGAALLLTPGFLTDLLGFSLLIPVTRALHRRWLERWIRGKMSRGEIVIDTVATRTSAGVDPRSLD